jgi:protein pelota
VHSSSGQKQALSEILEDENMQIQLADTKYAMEVKYLQTFYRMLSVDPLRACYGYDHVFKASEQGAVETLMMTDALFRYLCTINRVAQRTYQHAKSMSNW